VIIRPDPEGLAVVKALRAAGVRVMLRRNEHVKELLADGAYFSLSMNLSRKEIRVSQQAGFLTTEPDMVAVHAAALESDLGAARLKGSVALFDRRQCRGGTWAPVLVRSRVRVRRTRWPTGTAGRCRWPARSGRDVGSG
jgi:hypothetical protein